MADTSFIAYETKMPAEWCNEVNTLVHTILNNATTAADVRTALSLGTLALSSTISDSDWSGTDLAIANGGTGASTAANARTNLGLAIGSDVQAYHANLANIAGLANTDGNIIVGNGSAFVAESGATARTSLGVAIGTDVQAYDANLTSISGLANTDGNFFVGTGSGFTIESGATARLSLGFTDSVIQVVEATPYTTYSSHTTQIPVDNTIPQNTEGEEIITVSITPNASANRLIIICNVSIITSGANGNQVIALFQDSTADALAVSHALMSANTPNNINLFHEMAAGTTSSTTFKIRIGPDSAITTYINGDNASRLFGGIASVRLRVMEVA